MSYNNLKLKFIYGVSFIFMMIPFFVYGSELEHNGSFNGFDYTYKEIETKEYFFNDHDSVEILYFFNYKCPYSYNSHNMMVLFERTLNKDQNNFYNIPLSEDYSLDLFILSKYFFFSFEDELLIYENLLKEIRSENHASLVSLYAKILGVSKSAIQEILKSNSFKDKKDFLLQRTNSYNVDSTPYAIVNVKGKTFEVRGSDNINPINLTISISRIINKYNN